MHVTAIVVAAGKGVRFKSRIPKPLVTLGRRPVIAYCLRTLSAHPYVKDIIIVVNAGNKKSIADALRTHRLGKKVTRLVLGGPRRQDSVRSGLRALPAQADTVLIHDAARPFIDAGLVSAVIQRARRCGAAVAAVPVKATIKRARGGKVGETLDRSSLWEIQTPQVFKKDLILEAYRRFSARLVTDDAALVERLGSGVELVMGSYRNIKLTTPEDLSFAKGIIRTWKRA
ncbi:MAG TPA: 2-C-methyl-D-erythritol 4-phosphate cytidylyltransferase [Patescibacteria group bacterium]|nr:2-C-methyl-D-erythritol 4-phosphate cytidylyltransferase [Patescibacteria group bacterium]